MIVYELSIQINDLKCKVRSLEQEIEKTRLYAELCAAKSLIPSCGPSEQENKQKRNKRKRNRNKRNRADSRKNKEQSNV